MDNKPDYKGFGEHLTEANAKGIPIDLDYLYALAKMYKTPIPGTPEWKTEFSTGWQQNWKDLIDRFISLTD